MKYTFTINERLPGMNEFIKQINYNRHSGNKLKRNTEEIIFWYIKQQLKNLQIEKSVLIKFTWIEENKKRDLDNICAAKKFILDALVKSKVIKNDTQQYIKGFLDEFKFDKKSSVIVELIEIS